MFLCVTKLAPAGQENKGQVLDVAMGDRRNAVYPARLGFRMKSVDISSRAVNNALQAALREGLRLEARVCGY